MIGYRREIDGLRALAILSIVLFHTGNYTFSGGFVGVDVFFVISGYLITSVLLSEKEEGTFSIINFYYRRARRILPALFLMMAVCIPFAWLWLPPNDLKDFSKSLVAVAAFVSNILFWRDSGYFDTGAELKPLLHAWSLAVEEQYYVLFPLFLALMWRRAKRWTVGTLVVIGVSSLTIAQWGAYNKPVATFFLLPTRGWEFSIGAFIAFYVPRNKRFYSNVLTRQVGSALGLALILYAVVAYDKETPFPSLYALVPTIGTALIILFATQNTLVGKILAINAFVKVGLISYSLYLWHQPLFAFARHRSLTDVSGAVYVLLLIVALLLAYLSWRFVENPCRNKNIVNNGTFTFYVVIFSLSFMGFGFYGHLNDGFPSRFNSEFFLHIQEVINQKDKQMGCWTLLKVHPAIDNTCVIGALSRDATFAVVGDSHAGSLVPGVADIAIGLGKAGRNFTYTGCPPIEISKPLTYGNDHDTCNRFRESFFNSLGSNNLPNTLVLSSRWTIMMEGSRFDNQEGGIEGGERSRWENVYTSKLGHKSALKKDYVDSVKKMLAAGHKVVLIYPIPEMGWDVPQRIGRIYVKSQTINAMDASTSYDVFKERNRDAYEALDSIGDHINLFRVYPERLFCSDSTGRCIAHLDGELLYYDDNHVSALGAKLIANDIKQVLSL